MTRNTAIELRTDRLVLVPLRVADADEMAAVLADESLYRFTGGEPPSIADLRRRYAAQIAGPLDGRAIWHNWIVRLIDSSVAAGYVQATVEGDRADIAWVIGVPWQGRGFAGEAAGAIAAWLLGEVTTLTAHIHPEHQASARVAATIGLQQTAQFDDDGEEIWAHPAR